MSLWFKLFSEARNRNPLAALRTPIGFEDYDAARMVRDPLCLLDMELPVDGADAFVLTSAERSTSLPHPPVLVHATATGMVGENTEDQLASLAGLLQGQADEGQPVVLVRGGFADPAASGTAADLIRPPEQDLFR